jgi:hypothetical protein
MDSKRTRCQRSKDLTYSKALYRLVLYFLGNTCRSHVIVKFFGLRDVKKAIQKALFT